MKYIHIVQFHLRSGGGVGSVITDVSEKMSENSKDIYIFSLQQYAKIDYNETLDWSKKYGINSELMQKDGDSKIKAVFRLRKRIKELAKEDDLCLFMHLKWGVLAGIFASFGLKNVKRVEVYHSGYMNYKLQAFLCKPFINNYIAVSKEAKEQLIKWFNVKADKIKVVYNGVDVEHIKSLCKNRSLSETENGKSFISVGRLSQEKNFLLPIRAFSELKQKGELSNATYTMVGDGAQRAEAETLSDGNVLFTGVIPRDDVYPIMNNSDVAILPSLWEGNSILLLEVLAVGKAVIVSDIPSFREVLNFEPLNDNEVYRQENFGAVFKKDSIDSFKSAVIFINSLDSEKIKAMSEYVGSFVSEFSINNQAEAYFKIA